MTPVRFTLTVSGLGLETAQGLAEAIDNDIRLNARAVAINETGEQPSRWELVAYFESEADVGAARQALAQGTAALLPDADWVRKSLEGLPPITAGRFFLHGSHDRHCRRTGGISLEIDAGTAFGTGHHGTTEGCLMALDQILKRRRPARILDVGCGTGVLAIAAARATRSKVLASDIDPEAVRVARRNARTNGVGPAVTAITAAGLKHPRMAAKAPYDLVFANILARPLVSLAQGLSRVLAPNGLLILSGLTIGQCRWLRATYRNRGLMMKRAITIGDWATLVLTRRTFSDTTSVFQTNHCGSPSRRRRLVPSHG